MSERIKVVVVFTDGTIKEFYSSESWLANNTNENVYIWENVQVDNRSVDRYSIPFYQVKEIFEYE